MTVEWRDSRWPRLVGAALRALNLKAAGQGALYIRGEEPRPLGRMTVTDEKGRTLHVLIDATPAREKRFILPAEGIRDGAVLRDADGRILYAWAREKKTEQETEAPVLKEAPTAAQEKSSPPPRNDESIAPTENQPSEMEEEPK